MYKIIGLFLAAPIAFFAFTNPSLARSNSCLGSVKQPHPDPFGNFNFETNSLYAPARKLPGVTNPGSYKFGFVSCVSNPDPKRPLYVNWLIPGPTGWVQPKSKLNSVPELTNESKPLQLDGCLEYGNRGGTTRARFLGTKDDRSKAKREHRRGCRNAVANAPDSAVEKFEDIILKITNYFPSDTKHAADTMLKLTGVIGIKHAGTDGYTSFMEYKIRPYGKSDGSVRDISIRPDFRGAMEQLLPIFRKENGATRLKLATEGHVAFTAKRPKMATLAYSSYEILDRNNRTVAAVGFPVFVSPYRPAH